MSTCTNYSGDAIKFIDLHPPNLSNFNSLNPFIQSIKGLNRAWYRKVPWKF